MHYTNRRNVIPSATRLARRKQIVDWFKQGGLATHLDNPKQTDCSGLKTHFHILYQYRTTEGHSFTTCNLLREDAEPCHSSPPGSTTPAQYLNQNLIQVVENNLPENSPSEWRPDRAMLGKHGEKGDSVGIQWSPVNDLRGREAALHL